ncbi:helix-turn-helix transcriptional regulator [Syntrophomonas wolfei]|jgi:putative molybdopterin biosynthesis protein|uniref:helix-turn-helix transcriptional regulator n=1 Tax=Syntrophomonas wolfei TaxID=863 RepID=UPI0023F2E8B8|nr:helix-turn-helix transcriptional regulator [Syntrophomonas wolfei]
MKEDRSLTPQEVAKILKITKYTVYEMVKRGELPAYRIGRKIRIEQRDVDAYIKQGKKYKYKEIDTLEASSKPQAARQDYLSNAPGLVICGQDLLLDVLSRHLESHSQGCRAFRHNIGSFAGLLQLYQGESDMAGIHLWDSDSDSYNIPYVRRMVPGISTLIIHLAMRQQGFYVARGNPLEIKGWEDLTLPDLRFINREPGCGTRVLLDEHLYQMKLDRRKINGYKREETSHLAVASAVARGTADLALGNEKAAMQVRGIEFIPLQKERYELVIRKEDHDKAEIRAALDIINSAAFKSELEGLGDYCLEETGRIVAEI